MAVYGITINKAGTLPRQKPYKERYWIKGRNATRYSLIKGQLAEKRLTFTSLYILIQTFKFWMN